MSRPGPDSPGSQAVGEFSAAEEEDDGEVTQEAPSEEVEVSEEEQLPNEEVFLETPLAPEASGFPLSAGSCSSARASSAAPRPSATLLRTSLKSLATSQGPSTPKLNAEMRKAIEDAAAAAVASGRSTSPVSPAPPTSSSLSRSSSGTVASATSGKCITDGNILLYFDVHH